MKNAFYYLIQEQPLHYPLPGMVRGKFTMCYLGSENKTVWFPRYVFVSKKTRNASSVKSGACAPSFSFCPVVCAPTTWRGHILLIFILTIFISTPFYRGMFTIKLHRRNTVQKKHKKNFGNEFCFDWFETKQSAFNHIKSNPSKKEQTNQAN